MGTRDRRAINGVRRAPAPSGDPATRRRGLFVVLEGIDGSGKSVQAARLSDWLEKEGIRVIRTFEPTVGTWGRKYRDWANGRREASREEVLAFFLNDRAEHVEGVIRPGLEQGAVVVCDRYNASTLAYQAAHGVERETLHAQIEARGFPDPDLTLWLRVPLSVALERKPKEGRERYEQLEFLERVEVEYARMGLTEVDGGGSCRTVAARVRAVVQPLLEERGLLSR
jgi:dTMP kinase